jgi:hypothetical protein
MWGFCHFSVEEVMVGTTVFDLPWFFWATLRRLSLDGMAIEGQVWMWSFEEEVRREARDGWNPGMR